MRIYEPETKSIYMYVIGKVDEYKKYGINVHVIK